MKKVLWLSVVIAVLIAGGLVWFQNQSTPPPSSQQVAQSDTPAVTTPRSVKVAANLPLSGPLSTYGLSVQEGVNFAIEQMESESVSLDIDWEDNAGAPKNTVSVMQKQFLADPDIYVSGVKPQTMAIIDQVSAKNIPHFVWIFDPVINKNSSNNFRTWVSYKIEPSVYFSYAEKQSAKKVSILYVQLPHTVEEFEQIVVPGLKERG
ncbi:MAG: amino acid ABC transporter substrate-binding protein, partial [Candidatus Electrothrix sp. MAN1_4]|nr:amino acid ABC transporter substrate-binding protein [Candidatus Electrothrix sp. MAN1_4]